MTTTAQVRSGQLYTGEEYLESLRDGREVYLDGERVADVTTHPAFRNSARSVARLYDALHDPEQRDLLTAVDRHGIRTHKFFTPSYSAAGAARGARGDRAWARMSLRLHGPHARLQGRVHGDARRRSRVLRAVRRQRAQLVPQVRREGAVPQPRARQPAGRPQQAGARGRGRLRARRRARRDDGHRRQRREDARDRLGAHARDVRRPEQRRRNWRRARPRTTRSSSSRRWTRRARSSSAAPPTRQARRRRSTTRSPAASTRTTPSLIFDDAFIPWENVLVYRDVERANAFYRASGFFSRYNLQSGTRLGGQARLHGRAARQGRSRPTAPTSSAACRRARRDHRLAQPDLGADDRDVPRPAARPRRQRHPEGRERGDRPRCSRTRLAEASGDLRDVLGGAPLVVPSSTRTCTSPELRPADRPVLPRLRRARRRSAIKLFKLIWDAIGTEFGGRHELYERNYSRQPRADAPRHAEVRAAPGRARWRSSRASSTSCMADYDLDGFTAAPWANA